MRTVTSIIAIFLLTSTFNFAVAGELYDLRCENLREPLAIDNTTPRFSWKIRSEVNGYRQTAYRIVVYTEPESGVVHDILWDSGKVPSSQSVLIPYDGRELQHSVPYYWKVNIWDGDDRQVGWTKGERFGIGLLGWEDWHGDYIGMPDTDEERISPVFRKTFDADPDDGTFLLHVNSLGYHELYVNGRRVGDEVLAPAVSQLDKRSLSVTYDVTGYLADGHNEIRLWLGQGWYKQNLWDKQAVHNGPLVRAVLYRAADGKSERVLSTDPSWECARTGWYSLGSWLPHQFGGEMVDARIKDEDFVWHAATVYDVKSHAVSPQMCEPNIIHNVFPAVAAFRDSEGVWIVDMGTTLTGWAEIKFPKQAEGRRIVLEYADHYDMPDQFSTELGHTDIFICSGERDTFRNRFNYHSFRFIRISNLDGELSPGHITGYAIRPSFDDISSFVCSDEDMNAIHDMVKKTFSDLTLGGYLVDCQHIERLGYGGDGNASAQAFQTMYGVGPLYTNWMQAWADAMRPGGSLPHTAPNPLGGGGGPYWCAFMVAGPWRTYVNYGDVDFLEKYYPYMESFMEYMEEYTTDGLLGRWPDTDYRGWFLGDWACPEGIDATREEWVMLVASCVASECYDMMEKAASVLGRQEDAKKYSVKRLETNRAIYEKFYNPSRNIYAAGTQIDMAFPLLTGAMPHYLAVSVHDKLKSDIETVWNGHLAAGLVGVTKVTEWATATREADVMYSMLKKRDYPGYLYMIDNGATSTWEYWDGMRSRIHNCYNGIGSWFYQAVGGINADHYEPGYRHAVIDIQVPAGITWANTTQQTPYGELAVYWRFVGESMSTEIAVPVGSHATVIIPDGYTRASVDGQEITAGQDRLQLQSGRYTVLFD